LDGLLNDDIGLAVGTDLLNGLCMLIDIDDNVESILRTCSNIRLIKGWVFNGLNEAYLTLFNGRILGSNKVNSTRHLGNGSYDFSHTCGLNHLLTVTIDCLLKHKRLNLQWHSKGVDQSDSAVFLVIDVNKLLLQGRSGPNSDVFLNISIVLNR
jgi:hypothetical protein